MSDPYLQPIGAQLSALTAQIQAECSARAMADDALSKRIGSLEAVLTGDIQSANYVPKQADGKGGSGWNLNVCTDELEINSCTLGSAANAPERQMVSVEVASWSKYDLPKNAANLLQFMQAELERVPEEHRRAAEFEEFDASYGDEPFNGRLFLSYSRLETEEELADRLEKAKVAGTHLSIKNDVLTYTHDGVVRIKIGNLEQPEPEKPQPFKVDIDRFFINKANIRDGITWPAAWCVKMELGSDGKLYHAGMGIGSGSNGESRPDIIVKASHMEILPDGLVRITQAPKKS